MGIRKSATNQELIVGVTCATVRGLRSLSIGGVMIKAKKMKSLLDSSHDDSHAWNIIDTTPGFIKSGASYVSHIYDKYIYDSG